MASVDAVDANFQELTGGLPGFAIDRLLCHVRVRLGSTCRCLIAGH